MLSAGSRLLLIAVAAAGPTPAAPATSGTNAAAPAPATPGAVTVAPRRTTTLIATEEVGAPLERAFPSAAYTRAAAKDAEGRWDDARSLYRQAADEWQAIAATRPSRPLEDAIAKAEHEMIASQALAARAHNSGLPPGRLPDDARRMFQQRQALDDARLLRLKLMTTRAALGRLSPELYARTRARLEEARDAGAHGSPADGHELEVQLLLCATFAVGGEQAAARLAHAHLTQAARDDPANALAIAVCDAALGQNGDALSALESFVLRPTVPRPDGVLREIYLSSDWDRLRGDPRFESLFP